MEVLVNKPFDYAVIAQDQRRYFVIACGTSAMFDIWIEKTVDQADALLANPDQLSQLIETVRLHPLLQST
jgi:hypothetical protein